MMMRMNKRRMETRFDDSLTRGARELPCCCGAQESNHYSLTLSSQL